jgi:hypothetical protein
VFTASEKRTRKNPVIAEAKQSAPELARGASEPSRPAAKANAWRADSQEYGKSSPLCNFKPPKGICTRLMKNWRKSLVKLLIVGLASFFLLTLGFSMIGSFLFFQARPSLKTPASQDITANEDKGSDPYDPDRDNFYKDAEWMESKFGKDTIQSYELPLFKNGYLNLVPGADHARYKLKDFTITVAYVGGRCVEIRYQRTTSPFQLDNYEIQQILAANSGGFTWRKQAVSIFNPVSVVQPLWKRDDGATATTTGAFITIESPAAKEFLERKTKEDTEQRHREEPRF